MTLTDPDDALAEQSTFIEYLLGLAGLARMVRLLAGGQRRTDTRCDNDDFVHVLLGLAGLGQAVERSAATGAARSSAAGPAPDPPEGRWLR
ncbi:hypothetical protein ABGB19_21210 [Mycobacterium sp. B14F4]|uniref:hypothetical protein n=1 Tax=Mycobacterium sp. B14F4 TaxID=3153565 RepID=UPI00325F58D4